MDRGQRIAPAVFLLAAAAAVAGAQPCLIQGEPGPLKLATARGVVEPRLEPAQPKPGIAVVLFPYAIAEQDRRRVTSELAALYRAARGMPLGFFVFDGRSLLTGDAVSTPAAWQKLVQGALATAAAEAGDAAAPGADAAYRALADAAAGLGGQWQSVLLVGLPRDIGPELRDYALAWMTRRFCSQKLRVSYWTPVETEAGFWTAIARATAGASHVETLAEFPAWAASGPFYEATWPVPSFAQGFVVEPAKFNGADLPIIDAASGAVLPAPAEYAAMRKAAQEAGALARGAADAATAERARQALAGALKLNPLDAEVLRASADLYARHRDYRTAARLLATLSSIRPADAGLQGELGHNLFLAGELAAAEKPLLRAREADAAGPSAAEQLARILLARRDDRGAMPLLDEALRREPKRVDLWFERADVAGRLNDRARIIESLESGLAIDGSALDRRSALVRLSIEGADAARALRHVRAVTSTLPADAATRRQYAEFLERLGQPAEALAVWKKAIEADPRLETAHARVARLLLEAGKPADALTAAEAGLAIAPGSAPLHLARADALERTGRYYAARDALRVAARSVRDGVLLARLAEMEDVSGSSAAKAYAAAADAVKDGGLDVLPLLQRGLEVALRDGDAVSAGRFRQQLIAAGKQSVTAWLTSKPAAAETRAVVPGGLEGLAFIAHAQAASPQQFFAEYCRTLVSRSSSNNGKKNSEYLESIRDYFQTIAGLKALGTPKGGKVEIEVSVADKAAVQKSERILELLGWSLKKRKEGYRAESGEKLSQARRQEIASALAIDPIAMDEAVQAGRAFRFEIEDGEAPVLFGETRWLETFFAKEKLPGGLAEALSRDLRAAKAYAGLSAMDRRAAAALTPGADLKTLVERHSDLLYRGGSGLALRGSSAAVPGGPAAEPVWEKLAGAPPSNPGRFFRALLDKDDGVALAFYNVLGQLDTDHQRFLTLSPARATAFYELFRESPDMARGAAVHVISSSFVEFLREIPLDENLRVLFPGSAEVWMVAKGKSSSASSALKLTRKLARVTAPEQEDEILIRLARTRYKGIGEKLTECDNFVAVVRIDRHRVEPLEEASAILLAQHYATAGPIYPYFATLTDLTARHFEQFFRLVDRWRDASWEDLNPVLAQVHSLIELLCLTRETDALTGPVSAGLFGLLCERFDKAASAAERAVASLETVRDLAARLAPGANADEAIERALLRGLGPSAWVAGGEPRTIDLFAIRSAEYRKVRAAQKAPALAALLECDRLLRAIAEGKGAAAEHIKGIEALLPELTPPAIDKKARGDHHDRKVLSMAEEARLAPLVARFKQRTSRKNVKLADLQKLRLEFLETLTPQMQAALSGTVYAYFFRPNDLLVSEDPLLLRKHRYIDPADTKKRLFTESAFSPSSEGAGSHFVGGFATFYAAVGHALSMGGMEAAGSAMGSAQFGSLRASVWGRLGEDDLRRFGLRLRVAREWILHAAADDEILNALSEETTGLLSPTRRTQLLDAISIRDWDGAMRAVTTGDLYALSARYLRRFAAGRWESPAVAALRASGGAPDDPRLQWLGGSAAELIGCNHSHLAAPGPYEQYDRLLFPAKLAERSAEVKLALADIGGRLGVHPAALGAIAEAVAGQKLAGVKMADLYDWRSVDAGWRSLDEAALEAALDKLK